MNKKNVIRLAGLLGFGMMLCASMPQPASAAESDKIVEGVHIGSVDVGGMDETEARSAVEKYVDQLLTTDFTLKGENGIIQMTAEDMGVSVDADTAVDRALKVGRAGNLIERFKSTEDLKSQPLVLDMQLSVDKQATARKLYENAAQLGNEAVDNSLVRENGAFRFVPGKAGVEVDIVDSVYAINDFLSSGWDGVSNEIDLVSETVEPKGSEKELSEIRDVLGSYVTDFSSSGAGRAQNVTNGVSKINGTVLYPGQEFSVYQTVSPFTQENGYELAGSYSNGTTVESFGGGICQVSTTLYNAVIRAELEVSMRFNHSMQVSYVQPSMDAAIAGTYKDFRFINSLDTPIYIEGYCSGGKVYFNIFGKETRAANREISFESETVSTTDPEVQIQKDSSVAAGVVSVVQGSHTGLVARMWKIVTVDGVEQSREVFNQSTYRASPRIILVGTRDADPEKMAALDSAIASRNESAVRAAAGDLHKSEEPEVEEEPQVDADKPAEQPSEAVNKVKNQSSKEQSDKEQNNKNQDNRTNNNNDQKEKPEPKPEQKQEEKKAESKQVDEEIVDDEEDTDESEDEFVGDDE